VSKPTKGMHHCPPFLFFCVLSSCCSAQMQYLQTWPLTCSHFLWWRNTGKQTPLWHEKINGQSGHVSEWLMFPASPSCKCLLLRLMLDFGQRIFNLRFCPCFTQLGVVPPPRSCACSGARSRELLWIEMHREHARAGYYVT